MLGCVVALLTVAASLVSAADVAILTAQNFDETTQVMSGEGGAWLIEFYAPWCGHCKKLEPVWTDLPSTFEQKSIAVKVGKVDATVEGPLAARFDVKGFPTILFFSDGQVSKYQGGRTVGDFTTFATSGAHTASVSTVTPAFTDEELKAYEEQRASKARRKPPVPADNSVRGKPSGERSYVMELTDDTFDAMVEKAATNGRPIMVYFYAPWCGHCKRLAPTWDEIAMDARNKKSNLIVAKVDATVHSLLGARFSLKGFPTIKYIINNMVYDYSGRRDQNALTAFLDSDWAELEGYPVPQATMMDQMGSYLQTLAMDLEKAWNSMKLMLLFVFGVGACTGFIVSSFVNLCCPPPPQIIYARRPPTATAATTARPATIATTAATAKRVDKPKTE